MIDDTNFNGSTADLHHGDQLALNVVKEMFADGAPTQEMPAANSFEFEQPVDWSERVNEEQRLEQIVKSLLPQIPSEVESLDYLKIQDIQFPANVPATGTKNSNGNGLTPELAALPSSPGAFNVQAIRKDFPILNERIHGKQLVWLDNAATTQKPNAVIERISEYYRHENSNIHRAAHSLAARSTDAYELARKKVMEFINAPSVNNIVFVRGATEAINLVAQAWGRKNIGPGDEVMISWLEHHANIVPWQQLVAEKGAKLVVVPINDRGEIRLDEYERLLNHNTKFVSLSHVSNALGTVNPVEEMTAMAHRYGAKVMIDGAQSVSHLKVDVQAMKADFFVFSGHKVFGPTGIGVLYGTEEVLSLMPPWQGGGNMIADVTFQRTVYQGPPARFEAGTGNIADAVGLGAALDYVTSVGIHNIAAYEHELLEYAQAQMLAVDGLRLIGTAAEKASVLSFVLRGYDPTEVSLALDREGIAVRSGHHCAQPAVRHFGLEATVRPSLAFYNTREEIDAMVRVLKSMRSRT